MENVELTNEEKEIIEVIKNISSSLLDNIHKLRDLEITCKTESEEFKKTIESIKSTLFLETSLYEKIDDDRINCINDYFMTRTKSVSLPSTLKDAMQNKESILIIRRIVSKLVDFKIKIFNKQYHGTQDEEIKDNLVILNLTDVFEKDLINTILCILNNCLNDEKYRNYKKELITLKYHLAFLFDFVLDDLLNNNFNINPNLYWGINIFATINRIDENTIEEFKTYYADDFNQAFFTKVANYEITHDVSCILAQIFLRASLLFIDDEVVKEIEGYAKKAVFGVRLIDKYINYGSLLLETYTEYEIDKTLPKIVSLEM